MYIKILAIYYKIMQMNSNWSKFGKLVHLGNTGIWFESQVSFWSKSPSYPHLQIFAYHHEWFENLHKPLWDEVTINMQGWTQHL